MSSGAFLRQPGRRWHQPRFTRAMLTLALAAGTAAGSWFYRFVLGIDQEPGTAGFGRLLLRPHPGEPLSWARGSYKSVRGTVSASWTRSGGRFTFRVEIPPNVTASVRVPSARAADVRDTAGNPPASVASFPGAEGTEEAGFSVGSGIHEFTGPAMAGPGHFL